MGVGAQKNIRERKRKKEAEAGAREARRRGRLDERGGEEATQRDGTEGGTRRIRGTSRAQVTKSSRPGRFLVFVGFGGVFEFALRVSWRVRRKHLISEVA